MEELIPLFAIFFVIGVPVMSLAARFVLRPLIMDVTKAIKGGKAEEIAEIRDRLSRLETHMSEQAEQLDRLIEAELFRRQLEAGPDPKPAGTAAPLKPEPPGWRPRTRGPGDRNATRRRSSTGF